MTRAGNVYGMTHSCVWHDWFMCVTWLIHVCDMTHLCAWCDWFMCVTWLMHVYDEIHSCVWLVTNADETGYTKNKIKIHTHSALRKYVSEAQIQIFCTTRILCEQNFNKFWKREHTCKRSLSGFFFSCVRYDSFMCVTWLIHVCDLTNSCVWHESFMYVTWIIHVCDVTHSCMWHDSFIYVTGLIHIRETGVWRAPPLPLRLRDLTFKTMAMTHLCHMGWLWLVGSLKLYISFAEYRLFYRALLQKRPVILRSLLVEATPYTWHHHIWLI